MKVILQNEANLARCAYLCIEIETHKDLPVAFEV
jgi:hypothetical protein